MARRAAKVDANQSAIVEELRRRGYSVSSLAMCGGGVPDLALGWRGRTMLYELKDPAKPPSARKLTSAQIDWHANWQGHCAVVESVDDIEADLRRELEAGR